MACLLCQSPGPFRHRYTRDNYRIEVCARCGLTQLNPLPSHETLQSLYGDGYFSGESTDPGYDDYFSQEKEYLATFAEDVRRIGDFVSRGKILDVGCGHGYFITSALDAGYEAFGMDIAEQAVRVAEAREPGRVFHGTIDDVEELRGKQFDVIFTSHVIEHICDPAEFVRGLTMYLADTGILVVVTPNIKSFLARCCRSRWVSFKVPEHVAYYSPLTITELFNRCGLRTVAVDPAYQYYKVPFVAKKLRELFYPLSRVVPRLEDCDLFSNRIIRVKTGSLRVIAKKIGPS